ncbi:MAG: methyltransferase domain-containing protein [Phycisphaerae bacterium]
MTPWNPKRYLQFSRERELPCRDLIGRVRGKPLKTVVDLGCGPGNSTAVIRETFPDANIIGIDSSADMLAAARAQLPGIRFINADIRSWSGDEPIDLIFSNAALQWVDDHAAIFSRLESMIRPGGYLAVQMPYRNAESPISRVLREVETDAAWKAYFQTPVRTWAVQAPENYYNMLCRRFKPIDIWLADYHHPLPDARAVIDWYLGTSLRPYLDVLPSEQERQAFLRYCGRSMEPMYPVQSDGGILFSIRRLLVVARHL